MPRRERAPIIGTWGKYPPASNAALPMSWTTDALPLPAGGTVLPRGQGNSYGDACTNDGGTLIDATRLSRFLAFDDKDGTLTAEAGVTLAEMLKLLVPRCWFPPVVPGTKHVTLGGMIAADAHGKNQHAAGSIGRHIASFELLRSDGRRLTCSPDENADLFAATIGGIGLTGLITKATIRLKRIPGPLIAAEHRRCGSWQECLETCDAACMKHEYAAAWMDCAAGGKAFGRGIVTSGSHDPDSAGMDAIWSKPLLSVPGWSPRVVSRPAIKAYNRLRHLRTASGPLRMTIDPFFFPLDGIGRWNNLYGKKGLIQYQCVVPRPHAGTIFETVRAASVRPFLVTVKMFRGKPSPGLLSFPRDGACLAFDYAVSDDALALARRLDAVVADCGGAVYLVKDACMAPHLFRAYYPRWQEFAACVDPAFSSGLWRRVTQG